MVGPDRAGSSPVAEDRDIEGRLRQARESGLREGRADAEREAIHRIEDAEKRLARAVAELAGYRARLRREAERDVVLLAIGIAQRILHRQIATDQGALQGLVKSALESLELRELQKVRVHTSQAAALEMALREIGVPAGVEVIADAGLEPGGLVFETVRGSFDASVATQLGEIERGFADLVERRGR
jgi:flagellar assembly protein FliH